MSKVISGSYTTSITLSSSADNPVTVTGTITVSGRALIGQSPTSWTITNQGVVESSGAVGIDLASGGSVGNDTGALISGYSYALRIQAAAGSVVNAGSMGATGLQGRGIALFAGGSVTNQTGGIISGFLGISAGGSSASTVINTGIISSSGALGHAITLNAGGMVTNQAGGTIVSSSAPVALGGSGGTIVNAGTMQGTVGAGVSLPQGLVDNQLGGSIYGHSYGVSQSLGTVTNAGDIIGLRYSGVALGGGVVTNQSGGTIVGGQHGIYVGVSGTGTVINAGLIEADSASGIRLNAGGAITNQAGGVILGSDGIYIAGGTVVNAGTIDMTGTNPSDRAVYLAAGHTNRMVVYPGSSFNASIGSTAVVDGGNTIGSTAVSTLELASAASNGTLSGLGTQFIDFARIAIDAGVTWMLTGSNTIASGGTLTNSGTLTLSGASFADAGALENDGGIVLDPSTLTVAGLTGTGSVTIGAYGTLTAQASVAASESIHFGGANGVLQVADTTQFAAPINGFVASDVIDLTSLTFATGATASIAGGILTVKSGGTSDTLAVTGIADGTPFLVTQGAGGGTDVNAPCFAAGTRIATPRGEVPVEQLAIGDMVLTADGKAEPIVWIGWREVDTIRHPAPVKVWPVRVSAGAFGDRLPHRDLLLSPDHAVLFRDVLIPVRYLINGTVLPSGLTEGTIVQVPVDVIGYFHIELRRHDLLLAEGLTVESYLDTGDRDNFANGAGPVRLHADFCIRTWEALACRQLVVTGPELDAARQWLNARAARANARLHTSFASNGGSRSGASNSTTHRSGSNLTCRAM